MNDKKRQIVLDTETTGIGHQLGHRIIEIAAIELVDRRVTENNFHVYLNPQRQVDKGAFKIHGLSDAFLKDKPLFSEVVSDFLNFIEGSELIIHNAPFDIGFLNSELALLKFDKKIESYCTVWDSLVYAKKKHTGQRNNLDALCKRYGVDNSKRSYHGALLDTELLAYVYLAMTGGQGQFTFDESHNENTKRPTILSSSKLKSENNLPVIYASQEELEYHKSFIDKYMC